MQHTFQLITQIVQNIGVLGEQEQRPGKRIRAGFVAGDKQQVCMPDEFFISELYTVFVMNLD